MMKAVTAKEFDMVASWSVDRLGRSLTDLLSILQGLHEKGVGLFLHQHKARYDDMRDCMRQRRARGKSPRRGLTVNSWVGEKGRPPAKWRRPRVSGAVSRSPRSGGRRFARRR